MSKLAKRVAPTDRAAALFLHTHPLAFVAGIVGWITSFSITLLWIPWRFALGLSFALVMSHGFGAATWLVDRVAGGPWLLLAMYGGSAALLVLTWEQAGVIKPMDNRAEQDGVLPKEARGPSGTDCREEA